MESLKEHITNNMDLYKDFPEVSIYLSSNKDCILCEKEALRPRKEQKTIQLEKRLKKVEKNMPQQPQETADCNYLLQRLGIPLHSSFEYLEIKSINKEKAVDYVKTYLQFLDAIDLSNQKCSIKVFDEEVFCNAFNLNINDEVFIRFIEKLQNDPMIYSRKDKVKLSNILVFAFVYCKKVKIDSNKLKARLEEVSLLFKPNPRFSIEFQNDVFIDRFIIQLKENDLDLNEALFMNKAYLAERKGKDYINAFNKRLVESLEALDKRYVLSFLRHVFTYGTVLFKCIQNCQLIKLILSFYQNMNRLDATIEILNVLNKKIEDPEIEYIIRDELRSSCGKSKNHSKIIKVLEIRSVPEFSAFIDIINRNNESFEFMNLLLIDLKMISRYTNAQKSHLDLLQIVIYFFKTVKSDFLEKVLNSLLEILIEVFQKITVIDQLLVDFNRENWDTISNIVLLSQRDGAEDHLEKKKTKTPKESKICTNGLRLAECIYKIEEIASQQNIDNFRKLKEKGFKIG
ncbi:hypothetical protein GINT2_000410 [Glugoides intestinalis]